RACCFELGGSTTVRCEEREDTAAEFFGCKAVGGSVGCVRDHPELFGAAGGGVNHFRMAARERFIFFVTDEQYGKRASGDGFLWRNFRNGKSSEFFVAI